MRKLFSGVVIALLLGSISAALIFQPVKATTWTDVSVVQAKNMIDSNPSLVILDVRNQSEYDPGHIRNAKLIPLYELAGRLNELNKTDDILVYCKAGGRSLTASQLLVNNSFLYVYNMLGGFTAWKTAGYMYFVKYPSIQVAINNATNGASIYVSSGNYTEHLIINKTINLIGENEYKTVIDGSGNGTIFKVEADNVSICSFTMQFCGSSSNGYSGISVDPNHRNVTIVNNKLFSDGYGIYLTGLSSNDTISGNIIANNTYGIYGFNVLNSIVSRNNLTANDVYGIYLGGSSSHNDVSINNITATNRYGIYLGGVSNNTVGGNTLANNGYEGIFLDYSSGNIIYHNYFVNNTVQAYSLNSINVWDDGSKGNYWSDYLTKYPNATNNSETWNTPYVIDANNTDHYPLVNQPIIPEFPSILILPLMMIAMLLSVILFRRKRSVKPISV